MADIDTTASFESPLGRAGRNFTPVIANHSDLTPDIAARRLIQRRQSLHVQAISYVITAVNLVLYASGGAVSLVVPIAYLACGLAVTGMFLLLSESGINNRFADHYLTVAQIAINVAVQFAFLVAAPQVGYAFLGVLFIIFSYGALRLQARQATIVWSLTMLCAAPIFLLSDTVIVMPVATPLERFAGLMLFGTTIGQCVFVGLYGSSLRRALYRSGQDLRVAYRRIEELAEIDELTGAYNRRCIMRMLDDEVQRARRSGQPLSVALIDLDWFKRINDQYGHPTGDEVLHTFSVSMFANVRAADRFGRYGGEEFLLLLPETANEAALRMLDRLRGIVADLDWSAFSADIAVTMSAGVAALHAHETPDMLLARADAALYAAKRDGRNRVAAA